MLVGTSSEQATSLFSSIFMMKIFCQLFDKFILPDPPGLTEDKIIIF